MVSSNSLIPLISNPLGRCPPMMGVFTTSGGIEVDVDFLWLS